MLEHQVTVQNQITYIKFKAPAVLKRREMLHELEAQSWAELSETAQRALTRMLDRLVQQLVFIDAVDYQSAISGNADYIEQFMARGPVDAEGRSLREFDLRSRLMRYPLSYLVYTTDFNTLPVYVMDYVFEQIDAYLSGRIDFDGRSQYTLAERQSALEILTATHPGFRSYLAARGSVGMNTAQFGGQQ